MRGNPRFRGGPNPMMRGGGPPRFFGGRGCPPQRGNPNMMMGSGPRGPPRGKVNYTLNTRYQMLFLQPNKFHNRSCNNAHSVRGALRESALYDLFIAAPVTQRFCRWFQRQRQRRKRWFQRKPWRRRFPNKR